MYKYGEINDTFYFTFAVNDASGSGTSGSVPSAKVRLVGAASDAASVYSATPYLLSHSDYPEGAYEVAIPATTGNGFIDGNEYSIFNTLAVGTQNPTGNIGGFTLNPILTSSSSVDLSSQDSKNNISSGVIQALNEVIDSSAPSGSINYKMYNLATENDLIEQLMNTVVQTYNTANTVGRAFNQIVSGTVGAPTVEQIRTEIDSNSTQLQTLTTRLSATRAGYLDNLSSGVVAQSSEVQTLLSRLTTVRAGYIDNLSAGAVALNSDMSTLLTRLSDTRANYLDNLSSGIVAQSSEVQELLARITTTRASYIDLLNNGSYGLAQLVRSTTPANTLNVDANGEVMVNNLTVGSAGISKVAESATLSTGSQVNTYTATQQRDGTYHQISDSGGTTDIYYQFDISAIGVPSAITVYGRSEGLNDDINVYGYNWTTTSWEQIGTMLGSGADSETSFSMYSTHVGTGANSGKVRVRFYNTGLSTATLYIDQLYVSYTVVQSSVGYANGSIWIDTMHGTSGSIVNVNGVADLPVNNWTDALSLATSLNIFRFEIGNDSNITLTTSADDYTLSGKEWFLNLNGQSMDGTVVCGATVSGNDSGSNTLSTLYRCCTMGDNTLGVNRLRDCGLAGTITLAQTGTYDWIGCNSEVAGTDTPAVDYGAAIGDTNLNLRHYSGGMEIQNMGQSGTDRMSMEGWGQIIINANCVGGTIAVRGNINKTDNSGGAISFSENARVTLSGINSEVDTAITDANLVTRYDLTAVSGVINNIFDVAAKLDTTFELDGSVYKFTENALSNAPVGASGTINFTAEDRANLESVKSITDILNTMIENVSGQRFTSKALEQTPSGSIDTSTLAKEATLNTVGNNVNAANNSLETVSGLVNTVQSSITTVDGIVDNIYANVNLVDSKLDSQSGVINDTGVKVQDVESGLSHIHAMQALFALTAKMSSPSSGVVNARNYGDSKNRVHWTVDGDNNRLTVTYDFD